MKVIRFTGITAHNECIKSEMPTDASEEHQDGHLLYKWKHNAVWIERGFNLSQYVFYEVQDPVEAETEE